MNNGDGTPMLNLIIFKHSSNQKGFSLIELVIVLFIICLLFNIATPVFKRTIEKHSVIAFARQLAGDVRYVRQKNINGELHPYVNIQFMGNKYFIRRGTEILEVKNAPAGVRFLGYQGQELYFSGTGVPRGIGATTIDITNSYGDVYEVIIMVATGRVRIQPHPTKW